MHNDRRSTGLGEVSGVSFVSNSSCGGVLALADIAD